MTRETKELRHHHANDLHPLGHFDSGKLFNCQHVRKVVHHTAQIIDAVRIGNKCVPGLSLTHLLGAAMVIPNVGNSIEDLLAVELEHYAKHSMGPWVLRAQIEEHEISLFAAPSQTPLLGTKLERCLLCFLFVFRETEWAHFSRARGMFFAQRMALPGRWHQDPFKVRMSLKRDAKHVPDFALVPIRRRPDTGHRWQ